MNVPCLGTYKVGDTTKSGEVVKIIHGQSCDVLVFEDANGHTSWETRIDPLPIREVKVHSLFNRLYARASTIKDKKLRTQVENELARALFRGLSESDEKLALGHFVDVAHRISQEALVKARVIYAIAGCCVAFPVAVAATISSAYSTDVSTRQVLIGIAMGVGGAWVSVVQRAWKLSVRPFELPHYLAFQGVTRILLGALFGGFVVVALKAGLLLTILSETSWGLAVASFVGGASERLVPELLKDAESGNLLKSVPLNSD